MVIETMTFALQVQCSTTKLYLYTIKGAEQNIKVSREGLEINHPQTPANDGISSNMQGQSVNLYASFVFFVCLP